MKFVEETVKQMIVDVGFYYNGFLSIKYKDEEHFRLQNYLILILLTNFEKVLARDIVVSYWKWNTCA